MAGAVMMLQFLLQLYLIAAATFTIVAANDNSKDIYSSFKNAGTFASAHRANGDLLAITILVMIGCSFGARYPWRTTILTAVLFVLLVVQWALAGAGSIPLLAGLHGVNAIAMIGLGGVLMGRNRAFRRRTEVASATR